MDSDSSKNTDPPGDDEDWRKLLNFEFADSGHQPPLTPYFDESTNFGLPSGFPENQGSLAFSEGVDLWEWPQSEFETQIEEHEGSREMVLEAGNAQRLLSTLPHSHPVSLTQTTVVGDVFAFKRCGLCVHNVLRALRCALAETNWPSLDKAAPQGWFVGSYKMGGGITFGGPQSGTVRMYGCEGITLLKNSEKSASAIREKYRSDYRVWKVVWIRSVGSSLTNDRGNWRRKGNFDRNESFAMYVLLDPDEAFIPDGEGRLLATTKDIAEIKTREEFMKRKSSTADDRSAKRQAMQGSVTCSSRLPDMTQDKGETHTD